jgi:mitogen-activated protein kinase kinase
VDAKPSVRKQIMRELQIMSDCSSPYIIDYYGCFPVDVHVGLVIEYMDAGYVISYPIKYSLTSSSLDQIYRRSGSVPIDIVGAVAEAVLKGLVYLYDVHRIIHRGKLFQAL